LKAPRSLAKRGSAELDSICIPTTHSLSKVVETLNQGGLGIALVIDESKRLQGIITDHDLRNLYINQVSLEECAEMHMNREFRFRRTDESSNFSTNMFHDGIRVRHLPVLDEDDRVVDLLLWRDFSQTKYENTVVIMAGGLGTRLKPYTVDRPKPLVPLRGKPIIDHVLETVRENGFRRVVLSVNHMSEQIESHCEKGEKWDLSIEYVREEKKLGTAGSIKLLSDQIDLPFLVLNGDVVCNVNMQGLVQFHEERQSDATMCISHFSFTVPYGVVDVQNDQIIGFREKPNHTWRINSGIYCLNPRVKDEIKEGEYLDMPSLFQRLRKKGASVFAFPIHEEWFDLGSPEDLRIAEETLL
jgi:dTDP-glucose pyrophosphorylase/CBS domain-containing protein